ncbi:hypothetical protein Tco_1441476 [Tanacetum coccineum]
MTDVIPSVGASHPRVSFGPAPSFRELFGDTIHRDFFPFSPGPYYATYPKGGIAGNCEFTRKEWDAPHQPTLTIESLSSDQLTAKMSVLHCLMMSHGGKLLARYLGLLQSHYEYVQSTDLRLKDLNRATILEAEKDEEILYLKATPLALTKASSLVAQTDYDFLNKIFEHAAEPLYVILQLEPEKLARSDNVLASRNAHVSLPFAKESTMTPAFASLELPSDTAPTSSVAALEPNEEWVNAMVRIMI